MDRSLRVVKLLACRQSACAIVGHRKVRVVDNSCVCDKFRGFLLRQFVVDTMLHTGRWLHEL